MSGVLKYLKLYVINYGLPSKHSGAVQETLKVYWMFVATKLHASEVDILAAYDMTIVCTAVLVNIGIKHDITYLLHCHNLCVHMVHVGIIFHGEHVRMSGLFQISYATEGSAARYRKSSDCARDEFVPVTNRKYT